MIKRFLVSVLMLSLVVSMIYIPTAVKAAAADESIFDSHMEFTVAELGVTASQGTLFGVKKSGKIVAVKRYIADAGVHKVSLWETDSNGSEANAKKLAGIYDWNAEQTGWQVFDLPEAVEVKPGKYYLVAISTSTSVESSATKFSAVQGYFSTRNSVNSNIITYSNSSRQYNAGDGTVYPSLENTMWNFCIDVVYRADPSPASGEATSISDPAMFPNVAKGGGGEWNYGTEFQVTTKGKITKIRSFFMKGDSGKAYACLWNKDTGEKLINEIEWNIGNINEDGWREYTLATPVEVLPDVNYVVSVSTCTEGNNKNDLIYCDYVLGAEYRYNVNTFKEVYGVFAQDMHTMPGARSMEGNRSFFRDVVFEPAVESNPETNDFFIPAAMILILLMILSVLFRRCRSMV